MITIIWLSPTMGPKPGGGGGNGAKQNQEEESLPSCPPCPSLFPPLTPFNLLLLCAPTTEPARPCEPSLAAMPLPRAPWIPKGRFITLSLPALPLPNMWGAHGSLPRPGADSRGQETEISPLVGFLLPSVLGGFAGLR